MAFDFVVENGSADPCATSYVCVEWADDYVEQNGFVSDAWLALDDDVKERWLARSSTILDARVRWNGRRYDPEQGLKWPRVHCHDIDGYLIPDDVIPKPLMEATVEFATYLINGDDWTAPQATQGMREISVDVIDLKLDSTYIRMAIPDTVRSIIENNNLGWIDEGVQRTAFKKIRRS
jgi:hypothetical protein